MRHVVAGDSHGGVVRQRAGGIILANVLEGLECVSLGIDEWKATVKAPVPRDDLVFGRFGVVLCEPEKGDLVLAADELVHMLGRGIVLFEQLEAVVGIDVLLALKLGLGEIVLTIFADRRALAFLGDLGEFLFRLGELALLKQRVRRR